ncbi:MAG: NPCBM/NEW2 domain-containing protein [Chthoniobacteraceae bacterium]|nr:NPCBM/NEW2 domain-containing protein [Chthoniobacteraceae bacterium]
MNRRSVGLEKLLCLLCCWPILLCHAGSVRLLNGESHNGKVTLASSGVAVAADHTTTTFDLANIFSANFSDRPASEIASFPIGVVLTNGSFVPGGLKSFDEPAIKLGSAAQPLTVQRSAIAAIVFTSTPRAAIYRIPNGKTGAILPNGDFFEGTFTGIQKNSAVINSALFGPHPFVINTQISAVILRDIQVAPARYEIGAKDGSRFFSNDITINHDGLFFNDLTFGPTKVATGDLVEIRAGKGRYQLLTDQKPVSAVSASGADASSAVSTSEDAENGTTLSTGANVAATYAIPAGLSVFSCCATVPQDAAPAARVTFAIYCDGRLAFRSIQIAPGAAPQTLRVNCGSAQRITLRIEPAAPGSDAVVGKWIAPMFQRP